MHRHFHSLQTKQNQQCKVVYCIRGSYESLNFASGVIVLLTVTSSSNSAIKELQSLKLKKHREDKKLFFIEGSRFVEEALNEEAEILKVFLSQGFLDKKGSETLVEKIKSRVISAFVLSDKLFEDIADTTTPQGIMAVVKQPQCSLENVLHGKENFIVILDSIQDPGNLGTIIRTADAAGVTGLLLSKGCVDLYNPKVLRSTMGSVFRVPVCLSGNVAEDIAFLKSKGIFVCVSHLEGASDYFDLSAGGKYGNVFADIALVVGNEGSGVSEEVAVLGDMLLKIPMIGRTESLNASVAAGLLMYEVVRRRLT